MKIIKNAASQSLQGPEATFSGRVRIDNHFEPGSPSRIGAALVTFEPGARTAWHAHGAGQLLYVTEGRGWIQKAGEPKQLIEAGDTVWIAANEKHWHGASQDRAMSHVAVAEASETAPAAIWMEKVTDDEYQA
ncbi:cupin domain-containing protein [Shewanella algae]|uniref:(R)-mandelonitrile lyase n=1 Tax=Shewanella algae TaxID=38313 RepID=UPI0005EBF9CC|nr:cupin domain-containing protein [Shewanella algae]MBO2562246.1 cupin domain-containing protein [Shewanella algae]MBO2604744.1 cupin domain-containing protein [Shewanella algae]QNV06612.1 cupin domain-containing protein [Shewanella algae]